jgi:hypothetical protein
VLPQMVLFAMNSVLIYRPCIGSNSIKYRLNEGCIGAYDGVHITTTTPSTRASVSVLAASDIGNLCMATCRHTHMVACGMPRDHCCCAFCKCRIGYLQFGSVNDPTIAGIHRKDRDIHERGALVLIEVRPNDVFVPIKVYSTQRVGQWPLWQARTTITWPAYIAMSTRSYQSS